MIAEQDTQATPFPEEEIEGTAPGPSGFSPGELLADSAIGMFNNLIAIGGGWFVRIKKEDAFYDLEGFIQFIDEQNEANVRKLLLDEEDKAMLRPLLAAVLSKQANKFGPEQQLIAVAFTILMKKLQLIMMIRKENEKMEKRLVDIIEKSKNPAPAPEAKETPTPTPEPIAAEAVSPKPEPAPEPLPDSEILDLIEAVEAFETVERQPFDPAADEEKAEPEQPEMQLRPSEKSLEDGQTSESPTPEPKPAMEVEFSPQPSAYEKRIAKAFAKTGQELEANPKTLFLRMGMETGELEGVWFKDNLPSRHFLFKDILKMVFGSTATYIPGIGSLAKTKIMGFMAAKAEKYGLAPHGGSLYLAYGDQDRIVAKIIGHGAVQEALSIDQLVEQFQKGGVENAA